MASKAWKEFEKAIAKVLCLTRISTLNRGLPCEDVRGALTFRGGAQNIVGECKLRDRFPSIITDMIAQARQHAKDDDIPIAFLKKKRANIENTVVAMQLKDFIKLLEGDKDEKST